MDKWQNMVNLDRTVQHAQGKSEHVRCLAKVFSTLLRAAIEHHHGGGGCNGGGDVTSQVDETATNLKIAGLRDLKVVQELMEEVREASALAEQTSNSEAESSMKELLEQQANLSSLAMLIYYAEQLINIAVSVHAMACNLGDSAGVALALAQAQGQTQQHAGASVDDAIFITPFSGIDSENASNFQKLLFFLLGCAYQRRLRRLGDDCYEEVVMENGQGTWAWRRSCCISELVSAMTRKEVNYQQWQYMTQRGNRAAAIEYLTHGCDVQFPSLKRRRDVLSFRNGVYLVNRDEFLSYERCRQCLSPDVVAAKFFDRDFPESEVVDWFKDLPTPHLQSILEYQEFSEEVIRWFYVLIGRLLYPLNQLDGWQVIPFLKGQAASGKSTILRMCRHLYEREDVGVLSNNIERKFGLSSFYDKFMFVAPEVKSDLQLEQAEFQSIVSGEDVLVNIKFQKATPVQWTVPGILAGNEVPGWRDNAGSILRRIVVFDFVRSVTKADLELSNKLDAELPQVMLKCNKAYREAVLQVGSRSVWECLPAYFRDTQRELELATNPLQNFLASGRVQLNPDLRMSFEDFKGLFSDFLRHNHFGRPPRLTKDYFKSAFCRHGISCKDKSAGGSGGGMLIGIGLGDEFGEEEEEKHQHEQRFGSTRPQQLPNAPAVLSLADL
jgi:hypothetical protein